MATYTGRFRRLLGLRRPEPVVGVDVRQSEIRWVRYDPSAEGAGRISAGRMPQSDLKEGLCAMAQQLNLPRGARVSATVESSRVVVRHAFLPPMPETEIGPALVYQLPELIPGYTDDWGHDYALLNSRDQDGGRECLVAALPLAVIRHYHRAFKQAGLPLMSLEARTLALWRFLFGAGAAGCEVKTLPCLAVLDPDDHTADLAVFEDGALRYTRLLAGWQEDQPREQITKRLVSEIEHSLSWYREHRGRIPEALLVVSNSAGGGVPGDLLTRRLGLKVYEACSAWTEAAGLDPDFAGAAGLALKEVVSA